VSYEETVLQTKPGDMIVFFSDGIVDALNPQQEMFGDDRLSTLLQHHPTAHQSAEAAVEAILDAVTLFQAGTDHFDDETVVVLRAT
jgi:sigma-B regulation protein RsbU (phosphoserine phosphatase)